MRNTKQYGMVKTTPNLLKLGLPGVCSESVIILYSLNTTVLRIFYEGQNFD